MGKSTKIQKTACSVADGAGISLGLGNEFFGLIACHMLSAEAGLLSQHYSWVHSVVLSIEAAQEMFD
jgi:hypothetical protein